MKKIVILCLIMILLTGCTVNYRVEINDQLGVMEIAYIEGDNDLYQSRYKSTKVNVLKESLKMYDSTLSENEYQKEVVTSEFPYVKLAKKYDNIQSYLDNSILFNDYFDKINYHKDGNIIKIETEGFNPNVLDDPDRFYVENLDISIKCAYNVINSNATSIDKDSNTYHFVMDKDMDDFRILLEFDSSKRFISNLSLYISLLILFVITIGTWIYVFRLKKKKTI